MGTPEFAAETLKKIIKEGHDVVGVITAPDKPAGRGLKLKESEVKIVALENNLKILQPTNLKDETFINELKSLNADLQIVVAFRMLPEVVWSMPKFGTINLHASILPQYRGAAPINWAIINGEKETGVTTFFIEKEIDTGKIIHTQKVEIDINDNAGLLHDKLMKVGAELIHRTILSLENDEIDAIPQTDISKDLVLKPAPKIFKEDCIINWKKDAKSIYNFIRGLSPYPAAWTELQVNSDKVVQFKIFKAEIANENSSLNIITDNKTYLKVKSDDGYINILELQQSGKKRLTIKEFLMGFNISDDMKFI